MRDERYAFMFPLTWQELNQSGQFSLERYLPNLSASAPAIISLRSFEIWLVVKADKFGRLREGLTFWRTKHQQEVDFIIGDEVAVEVKVPNESATAITADLKPWERKRPGDAAS
ncbi:MAG TPA: hypothetical protein VFO10_03795 [Oligoflexus sp.]|uniref:hypothetical protein n=1 Tax=Oligoflexus sp. TaxID=1971216 RepID=UPI002D7FC787|nr:hypothetical protein [Oligoflexus sp.]HET9236342.1 hypothetical protein [Oligoflexus sp.]